MNHIINFLSEYGEKGALVSEAQTQNLLEKHGLTTAEASTVLSGKSDELAKLLDIKGNIYAILVPAEDDDDSEEAEESESIAA